VLGFSDLARHLDSNQPFYGLQTQVVNGEQVDTCVEDMATHYITEIRNVQPRGPYHIGGFCFGGPVAYEMAQQLRAAGEEVALLVLIQGAHPNYPEYPPGTTKLHRMVYNVQHRLDIEWFNLSIANKSKGAHLLERLKKTFVAFGVKLENMFCKFLSKTNIHIKHSRAAIIAHSVAKTNHKAYDEYKPKPYSDTITIFRTEGQRPGILPDKTLGWKELIQGELDLQNFPGYMNRFMSEPRVRLVAERLMMCMDKAIRKQQNKNTDVTRKSHDINT
jgi:thioesterase domain-containing protein